MTKSQDSPVTRETNVTEKGRPLIVTLKGSTMELRFKGKREVILLDYEVAVAAARKVAFREGGGQLPGKLGGRKFKKSEPEPEYKLGGVYGYEPGRED